MEIRQEKKNNAKEDYKSEEKLVELGWPEKLRNNGNCEYNIRIRTGGT